MTIKGYAGQKKLGDQQYATLQPVDADQHGIDVVARAFVQEIATDAAEAGSTVSLIVATAHQARRGDVIYWTSGALIGQSFAVKDVEADAIATAVEMPSAPTVADAFSIRRYTAALVNENGEIVVGVSFSNDTDYGVVGPDTLRTASQIGNATGAADFGVGNIGAQTLRVGLASDQLSGLATEATLADAEASLASLAGEDFATEATLAAAAADISSLAAEDFATQTTLAVLASKDFATQTTLAAAAASLTSIAAEDFATQTTLAAINTKTPSLGQAAMAGSTPVVIASDQTAIPVANLPTTVDTNSGAASASTLRSVLATRHEAAATPLSVRMSDGTNFSTPATKGRAKVSNVNQDLTSVTTSAYTQIVASTSAEINWLSAFESSGQGLILATGGSGSETDVLYIPPGGFGHSVSLNVASGTRLSIKALLGNSGSGRAIINFLS